MIMQTGDQRQMNEIAGTHQKGCGGSYSLHLNYFNSLIIKWERAQK